MALIHVALDGRPVRLPAGADGGPGDSGFGDGGSGDGGFGDGGSGDGGVLEALALLRDSVSGPTDPADAPVAVVTGRVAGVAGPGLARTTAVGLSPLSGGVAETRAEGPFAAGLRAAGLTGVVLHGRSAAPVCV
ncbi:MAG TPA: aldehyde ferredoxin oxidoreductase N-terminal domain-containing protein, partial [Rugosimonospora sp.]|nr:aldehyde ferredoxin oxidoreductase N-terminal domain-containing protein [Rugosimonospora sp.]